MAPRVEREIEPCVDIAVSPLRPGCERQTSMTDARLTIDEARAFLDAQVA